MSDPSRRGDVALMFSGGVDSTLSAVLLAKTHARVHLLTFETGYGHFNFSRSQRRVRELERIAGARFVFHRIPIRRQFKRFVLDRLTEDYREYGSGFVMCMGCKVLMHARTAAYARAHGIGFAADGASGATGEMVEQMLVSLSLLRYFYQDQGIEYLLPVYEQAREDSIGQLNELGFHMGTRILDRHIGIQPRCIRGEVYYLPYLLFNKPPAHDEQTIARFIGAKLDAARAIDWEA
jgi:hypothetical protein